MGVKACSIQPLVSHSDIHYPCQWEKIFSRQAPLEVEIGFGMGEVLIRRAQEFPQRNFVGIEQHWERIYKTLKKISTLNQQLTQDQQIENIRILRTDARQAFRWLFDTQSIEHIYCLFPCPWPKKGHVKNRLFSKDFLKLLNNRLKKNAELKVVTDYYPYSEWVADEKDATGFTLNQRTIEPQFDTKFERKWKDEGQKLFYELTFKKQQHIPYATAKEEVMKTYKLKYFDPEAFDFVDIKDTMSVIQKSTFYDEKKKKFLIHLIVSEQGMAQNLWVAITLKGEHWSITLGEGQTFYPTPGISFAMKQVFEAALKSDNRN